MREEKVDIADILLNRRPKHNSFIKLTLAMTTLFAILVIIILLFQELEKDIKKEKQQANIERKKQFENKSKLITNSETEIVLSISNKNIQVNTGVDNS
jgi:preprotein translocase subunit SecG